MQNYKYGELDVIVLFVPETCLPTTFNFHSAFLNANQLLTCRNFHMPQLYNLCISKMFYNLEINIL